jgi:hypothetical protein
VANKILSYYPFGATNVFPWDNTTLIPPARTIEPTPAIGLKAALSASSASPQPAGTHVTFVANASGGSGSFEYRFYLFSNGAWSVVQPYGPDPSWTWNTNGVASGTYFVWVDVRNVGSAAEVEVFKQIPYEITTGTLPITVGLTAAPASSAPAGDNVVFTATATGGSGSYEYRFWLFSGGAWSEVQPYGTANAWTWQTILADQGSHFVWVDVRNAGSAAEVEAFRQIGYLVQ